LTWNFGSEPSSDCGAQESVESEPCSGDAEESPRGKYRNAPCWQLAIDLKQRLPVVPCLCDPSHIAGNTEYILELSQQAINLDFQGLMLEVHPNPNQALSDAKQQLTPEQCNTIIKSLKPRSTEGGDHNYQLKLDQLRLEIDQLDVTLITTLARRMKVSREIGNLKRDNHIIVLQASRWERVLAQVIAKGKKVGLDEEFRRRNLQSNPSRIDSPAAVGELYWMTNIYLISGNDQAQIAAHAEKIILQVAGPKPDDFAFDCFQEGDAGPDAALIQNLLMSLKSPPFLGGQKTVWLKHFSGFASKETRAPALEGAQGIGDLPGAGTPKDIVLVMDGPGIDRRRALAKACADKGELITYQKPDKLNRNWQADMAACIQLAAKDKKPQSQPKYRRLPDRCPGTDTARIDSELEKIICYMGGTQGQVTLDEVRQICIGQGEEFSWAMGNFLGLRNLQECLRVIDAISEQSKDEDRTSRSLILNAAGFFRQALQIRLFMVINKISSPISLKRLLEESGDIQKQAWVEDGSDFVTMHPYRVQMIAEQGRQVHATGNHRRDPHAPRCTLAMHLLFNITANLTRKRID
jgi:chorismate mutase/DNA polymerase III delta subunit